MGMRNRFVVTTFLLIVLTAAQGCTEETPIRPPNVVFILADDMGFSDLGCYGGEIETPNLDGLAATGLRFTQFYNTTRCWPTRAALLTGYYAQQVRRDVLPGHCGGGVTVRPEWARLLPDLLEPAGYRSYHSGKWHIDGKVLDGGFHRSLDRRNQGNFFTAKGSYIDDAPIEPAADESGYYATTTTVDHALDCLREHADAYPERPFFHYIASHLTFPSTPCLRTSHATGTGIWTDGTSCVSGVTPGNGKWGWSIRPFRSLSPRSALRITFPRPSRSWDPARSTARCRGAS